ncbi:MAG TPA: hypothetical protein VGR26_14850 [Acidimicrobiales bacterium]|nr:hypothetical protein [Acidimicrobiales bacterium]
MPSLRIAGRWALMALPRRVLVRQLHDNAGELAELRDARCVLQSENNWLRAELLEINARVRAADHELAQAEAELAVYGRREADRAGE